MFNDNDSSSNPEKAKENLLLNIGQYKSQLDEVSKAIESANAEDKSQLQELQLNLISILELTLSQLDYSLQKNDENANDESGNALEERIPDNAIDDEFEKFQQEIAQLDENNKRNENEEIDEESNELQKDFESSLQKLEGQNVRVSFMEPWGGYSYHNAVVLSALLEENSVSSYENPQVTVLFCQPTCLSMLPCRFFLDGRCNFDSEKCKFSHGKIVAVEDLKEYKEPDRDKIVSGSNVLTLHEGQDLWHRGRVEDVLEDRSGFSVNCLNCATVYEAQLEAMFPLFADEEEESADKETENVDENKKVKELKEEENEDVRVFVPSEVWLQNSLSSKLGEWEKHTTGIGSKLMAKMGYIVGTGLGPKGEGRVDPVSAYVYPQGVSLDHCMRLREASNGEAIWEVEKRLLGQQKREEDKKKQQQKYLNANTSVFDIINNKLGSKTQGEKSSADVSSTSASIDVSKSVLKKNTAKELNKKNFQLSSNIEKLREEVNSLKRSRDRQCKDVATVKAIDSKLEEKMQQLSSLEKAANQIESEQQSRRNMRKLCSF